MMRRGAMKRDRLHRRLPALAAVHEGRDARQPRRQPRRPRAAQGLSLDSGVARADSKMARGNGERGHSALEGVHRRVDPGKIPRGVAGCLPSKCCWAELTPHATPKLLNIRKAA